jgi:hypothetical protein
MYESRRTFRKDGGGFNVRGIWNRNKFSNRNDTYEAHKAEAFNDYVAFKEKITQIEEAFLACLPEDDPNQTPETRLKQIEEAAELPSDEETKDSAEAEKIKNLKFLYKLIKFSELDRELNFKPEVITDEIFLEKDVFSMGLPKLQDLS